MRSGDLRPGSLPNLFALVRDNRAELATVPHVRSIRDRLIVETAGARRRMRVRIENRHAQEIKSRVWERKEKEEGTVIEDNQGRGDRRWRTLERLAVGSVLVLAVLGLIWALSELPQVAP